MLMNWKKKLTPLPSRVFPLEASLIFECVFPIFSAPWDLPSPIVNPYWFSPTPHQNHVIDIILYKNIDLIATSLSPYTLYTTICMRRSGSIFSYMCFNLFTWFFIVNHKFVIELIKFYIFIRVISILVTILGDCECDFWLYCKYDF